MAKNCFRCGHEMSLFGKHAAACVPGYHMCAQCAKKWYETDIPSHLVKDGSPKELFRIENVEYEPILEERKLRGPLIFFDKALLYLATWEKNTSRPFGGVIAAFGGALGAALLFPILDRLNKPKEIDASVLEQALRTSPCVLMFRREDIMSITKHWWWGFVVETCCKKFRYLNVPGEAMTMCESKIHDYVHAHCGKGDMR